MTYSLAPEEDIRKTPPEDIVTSVQVSVLVDWSGFGTVSSCSAKSLCRNVVARICRSGNGR